MNKEQTEVKERAKGGSGERAFQAKEMQRSCGRKCLRRNRAEANVEQNKRSPAGKTREMRTDPPVPCRHRKVCGFYLK